MEQILSFIPQIKALIPQVSEVLMGLVVFSTAIQRILPVKAASWIRDKATWIRTIMQWLPSVGTNPATKDLERKYNSVNLDLSLMIRENDKLKRSIERVKKKPKRK